MIDQHKARLVAQGFTQTLRDDYLETFSPTIRIESLRILLAIGIALGYIMRQIDVVSAYPNSKLHAEVYIRPPKGLDIPKGKVLRILQSLYRLKQSGREWYIEACKGLQKLGFSPYYSEPSIFTTPDSSVIIGLYIDDIIVLGAQSKDVEHTIQGISWY